VKVEGKNLQFLFRLLSQDAILTKNVHSIPVTLTFEQATGKNVLLLPMGSSTDGAHSINEKLDKRNYIEGIKLLGAYLHYVAEEPKE
jgi:Cys-Gly metallodipeptidase DUG1